MKRPFFEFAWIGLEPVYGSTIYRKQRWLGPHIRVGRFRINIRRHIVKYVVKTVPDQVEWELKFYYDRKTNSYAGTQP